ncbi:hypothetical protein YC2023_045905 [Brassica napus]
MTINPRGSDVKEVFDLALFHRPAKKIPDFMASKSTFIVPSAVSSEIWDAHWRKTLQESISGQNKPENRGFRFLWKHKTQLSLIITRLTILYRQEARMSSKWVVVTCMIFFDHKPQATVTHVPETKLLIQSHQFLCNHSSKDMFKSTILTI